MSSSPPSGTLKDSTHQGHGNSPNNGVASENIGDDFLQPDDGPPPKPHKQPHPRDNRQAGLIKVQPLRQNEMQPSYAQNLGLEDVQHGFYGSLMNGIGSVAGFFGQIPCCFCCPNPFHEVQQGSVGLISRFGQFYKAVDPGLTAVNPCSESIKRVDVKIQLSNIPTQSIITRDNLSIEVESVLFWAVSNPYRAVYGVGDVRTALIERAQTTLRDVVGSRNLQSVVQDREGVAQQVEEIVEAVAEKWGVNVESCLIKDIVLSRELQQSLSSAATQQRVGQAKIVAAKAEVEAAKLMRQAADVLASPAALQLRELEALQAMAKSAGSKVIFVPYQSKGAQINTSPESENSANQLRGSEVILSGNGEQSRSYRPRASQQAQGGGSSSVGGVGGAGGSGMPLSQDDMVRMATVNEL